MNSIPKMVSKDNRPAERTLRDEFAMAALTGLLSYSKVNIDAVIDNTNDAYMYADYMMEARKTDGS